MCTDRYNEDQSINEETVKEEIKEEHEEDKDTTLIDGSEFRRINGSSGEEKQQDNYERMEYHDNDNNDTEEE